MKKLFLSLLLIALPGCLVMTGCANVKTKVPIVLSNGSVGTIEISYCRWFNQHVEGLKITAPGGWSLVLNEQQASNNAAFQVGPYMITVGNAK